MVEKGVSSDQEILGVQVRLSDREKARLKICNWMVRVGGAASLAGLGAIILITRGLVKESLLFDLASLVAGSGGPVTMAIGAVAGDNIIWRGYDRGKGENKSDSNGNPNNTSKVELHL